MFKLRNYFFTAILLLSYYVPFAQVIGGDITWSCVGQDSFLVKLSFYRDCNGPVIGASPLYFNCVSGGGLITTLNLGTPTTLEITPKCATTCTRCLSSSCNFPYGMQRIVQQGIVNLSGAGSCCNVRISWSQCCRSSAITTLQNPGSYNFYTDAILNHCLNPCDNSPVFNTPPVLMLCVGQEFNYNIDVTDVDFSSTNGIKDSITYGWTAVRSAANSTIPYSGKYTYTKPVYFWGFPDSSLPAPRGIHLDQQIGDILFRPLQAEVADMVLRVNEFRNGVKIGELNRDIKVVVITCTSNNPPYITSSNNIKTLYACAGTPVTWSFSTNDPNSNDTVKLFINNSIPGSQWTVNNGQTKHPTGTFSWTPVDSQAGTLPYTFTLIAKDNACPVLAQYSQSFRIYVGRIPEATFSLSDSGCGKHYLWSHLAANSVVPKVTWIGDTFIFKPNTGRVVSRIFSNPGLYHYFPSIQSYGCNKTFSDSFVIDSFVKVSLPADTFVCRNSKITVKASVVKGGKSYSLSWGSGSSIFPDDTLAEKQLTVTKDTTLWIRAHYLSFNCPWDQIRIRVRPDRKITLPVDMHYCYLKNTITPQFTPNISAFRSFSWYKNGSSPVVDSDAVLNIFDSGSYACIATDTFGCPYTDTVGIHINPPVVASASDSTICNGKNALLTADSFSGHSYNYTWWMNNHLLSSTKFLNVNPSDTTQYSLIATETLNGISCSDTHLVTVFVNPLPALSFDNFGKSCSGGKQIPLDNFVKVNGQRVYDGTWTCPDEPSQVASNIFFAKSAYPNLNPGFKLVYSYTDQNSGCFNSDTVYLKVYPKPARPQIKVTGDTIFCIGYSVSLSAASVSPHYGWNTGDTVKQLTITASGKFRLAITDNNGCVSDSSVPVKVRVNPKPPKPVITLSPSDSFLECNLLNGLYEWYYRPDTFSSPIIINNSTRRINPKDYCRDCYYNIFFTDTNGCISNSSAYVYFYYNAIDDRTVESRLKFYPNPANIQLFVEYNGNHQAELIMTDVLGNCILKSKIISGKNEINIQNKKPGIYFIFMDGRIAGKIIID
jgi:hypothetical protein